MNPPNNEGTPTPLTDAAQSHCCEPTSTYVVGANFARQLERSLTATKQRLEAALRCFSAMPEARPHDRKDGVWHLWTQGCDHLKAALRPSADKAESNK